MIDYIEFLNVGFGSDGKTLQVLFKVNTLYCSVDKVYISTLNTWDSTNNQHSTNYIPTTGAFNSWTLSLNNTIYTLNTPFTVLKSDGITPVLDTYTINDLVTISVEFTINLALPGASDTTIREISIYDLLLMRLAVLRLINTIDCCNLPKELIDLILKIDVIENAIKAKEITLASKLWRKFYENKAKFNKKKGCNCVF